MIIAYSLALIAYLIAEIQRYIFYRLVRPYWISESWLIEASAALLPSRGQREACPDVEGFGFLFPSKSRFDERLLKSGSSIRLVMSGASKNVLILKVLIKKYNFYTFSIRTEYCGALILSPAPQLTVVCANFYKP